MPSRTFRRPANEEVAQTPKGPAHAGPFFGRMPSMEDIDVAAAISYNRIKGKRLWAQEDLPFPLSLKMMGEFFLSPDSQTFAMVVAMFQYSHAVKADGKLGPATYALMTSITPAVPESPESHDFASTVAAAVEDAFKPARTGVSNCLVIAGETVKISDELIAAGITASNYIDDGEKQFKNYRTRDSVSVFVLHESVTMSTAQTNRILDVKRRNSAKAGKNGGKGWDYGIHLNLSPDGHITCHADLVHHRLVQANQMNNASFGIEVVNPYNPKFAKAPFTATIHGPWWCWKPRGAEKVYTVPTPAQMRAMTPLCKFLCDAIPGLPLSFPTSGLNRRQTRIKNWRGKAKTGAGIVAHRDFASHADGRYLLEHVMRELKVT